VIGNLSIKPPYCINVGGKGTALKQSGNVLPQFIEPLLLPNTHVTSRC
jgi:hypothetical protein